MTTIIKWTLYPLTFVISVVVDMVPDPLDERAKQLLSGGTHADIPADQCVKSECIAHGIWRIG